MTKIWMLSHPCYTKSSCLPVAPMGIGPTMFTPNGALQTGLPLTLGLSGGSGLNTRQGRDAAKMIKSHNATCATAPPAGGSQLVTDLGPYDSTNTLYAEASFTFFALGSYQLCYRPDSETPTLTLTRTLN